MENPNTNRDVLCYFYDSILDKNICRVGKYDGLLKRWVIDADGPKRYYTEITSWKEIPEQ